MKDVSGETVKEKRTRFVKKENKEEVDLRRRNGRGYLSEHEFTIGPNFDSTYDNESKFGPNRGRWNTKVKKPRKM